MTAKEPFTIAAIQATPVFLDLEATVEKACDLIAEAGRAGAKLAVLPEAFIRLVVDRRPKPLIEFVSRDSGPETAELSDEPGG